MTRSAFLAVSAVVVLLTSSVEALNAQSWRTLTTSRQVRAEHELEVEIEYASGTLRLHPGARSHLYRVQTRYDEDIFESSLSFDHERSHLSVSVVPADGHHELDLDDDSEQFLDLAFSSAVPLSLDLKFGAATSEIELGGLAVRRASFKTGASQSEIGFRSPNGITCDEFEVAVGAAELTVYGLGHARCKHIKLAGGAGEMTLDFSGSWTEGFVTEAELTMGLGTLTLRIPEDVGVELYMSRFLASFDKAGFEKRGDRWVSANYDDAAATLVLHVRAILGDVNFDWIEAP